jgi:phosphotransferase system HPr (HPr) family protein
MPDTPPIARRQVVVIDPLGLHLRPAARLVTLAKSFLSDIQVMCKGTVANGRSLLELIVLAAEGGTPLEIVAVGPDADAAVVALADLIGGGLEASVFRGAAA